MCGIGFEHAGRSKMLKLARRLERVEESLFLNMYVGVYVTVYVTVVYAFAVTVIVSTQTHPPANHATLSHPPHRSHLPTISRSVSISTPRALHNKQLTLRRSQ